MKLSVIIPAHNEEGHIASTLRGIVNALRGEKIPFELVVVNDSSGDRTCDVVDTEAITTPELRLVHAQPSGGLGRAVRFGLGSASGDAIAIMMADASDSPEDLVRYYRVLAEGYDCVFGSRFRTGSRVVGYPPIKFLLNRLVNKTLQLAFMTPLNDLTNAFKIYRRTALADIAPLRASHFDITLELSLKCVAQGHRIAEVPIGWRGREFGVTKLHLSRMASRYFRTAFRVWSATHAARR